MASILSLPPQLLDASQPGKDICPFVVATPLRPSARALSQPIHNRCQMRFSYLACRAALAGCLLFALTSTAQHVNSSSPPLQNTSSNFIVVLDAAHGGSDLGAKLSPTLDEKSVTLALARRLRSALAAQGIPVVMTRATDTYLPMATRAGIANHAHAAACILLHATATGVGVHLFTSSLSPAPKTPTLAWQTAQSAYVNQSIRLSSDLDTAIQRTSIPVIVGRTFLQPLDNLTCPAVAIELAPQPSHGLIRAKSVSDPAYQSTILHTILAGILQWRQDWTRQP